MSRYTLMLLTQKGTLSLSKYLSFIQACIAGGVSCVQLREKTLSFSEQFVLGRALQQVLMPLRVPLIINDSIALALALDADGVHLGQQDASVHAARAQLGMQKTVGLTTNTLNQVRAANALPVDYIGIGPVFSTEKKPHLSPWGVAALKEAVGVSIHHTVAIGGIGCDHIPTIMETGVAGIAGIGLFHCASSPKQYCQQIRSHMQCSKGL